MIKYNAGVVEVCRPLCAAKNTFIKPAILIVINTKYSSKMDIMYTGDCIIGVYFVLVIKFIRRSVFIINRNL